MNSASMTSLKDYCSDAYVISYKENTSQLEDALLREGFAPVRVQTDYSPRQLGFSAAYRCLINHANAWHLAKIATGPLLFSRPILFLFVDSEACLSPVQKISSTML